MSNTENWVTVIGKDKIDSGKAAGAKVGDKEIAVYNLGGTYYATDNICTHAYAFLSEGFIDDDVVECPVHAGAFEIKTGKAVCAPASIELKTYPVRIVGNDVQIRVD